MEAPGLEQLRLALERDRFELEKRREEREGTLLNRHFGAIMTALVSIVAVVVSAAQIWVAQIQKTRELEVKAIESERQWGIEAAKFIAGNHTAIFSKDDQERAIFQGIIFVAFPKAISDRLLSKVKTEESNILLRRFWKPDGEHINQDNMSRIRKWLDDHNIQEPSITFFMRSDIYASARQQLVKELGLD